MATKQDTESVAHALREGAITTEDATRILLGSTPEVVLRGRFPAGTKVNLERRVTDSFRPGTNEVVQTKTVSKDSEVKFDGLEPGGQYWAAAEVDGEWRSAAVTAKLAPVEKRRVERPSSAAAAPGSQVAEPQDKPRSLSKDVPSEPQPSLKQEDVPEGTPQRSSTPHGEATPKDPSEFVPTPSQRTVKPNTPQRSSTEFGEAAIKDDEGDYKQEDAGKEPQRVVGDTGKAYPKPTGDPVKIRQVRDSSDAKARGADFNKAAIRALEEDGDGTSKKKSKAKPKKTAKPPEKRLGKTAAERLDKARQS